MAGINNSISLVRSPEVADPSDFTKAHHRLQRKRANVPLLLVHTTSTHEGISVPKIDPRFATPSPADWPSAIKPSCLCLLSAFLGPCLSPVCPRVSASFVFRVKPCVR